MPRSWKEINTRDKVITLGLNTSILVDDVTATGLIETTDITASGNITATGDITATGIEATKFSGTGVIGNSDVFGGLGVDSTLIATVGSVKKYLKNQAAREDQYWEHDYDSGTDVSYVYLTDDSMVIVAKNGTPPNGTLHFGSDVSFDRSIVALDASFVKLGGLNGTHLEIGDVSFSGTIGHTDDILHVTSDLSVNGAFHVSDASFSRVGELVSGSNVEFVSDVSFSRTIGHTNGPGTALEVTSDLSVNGAFSVSDASFARVGELHNGSNVEFVSDVSFDNSIVAVDASFVKLGGLNGTALEIGHVTFSGHIGHTHGDGNALEVTSDLWSTGPSACPTRHFPAWVSWSLGQMWCSSRTCRLTSPSWRWTLLLRNSGG